MIDIVRP